MTDNNRRWDSAAWRGWIALIITILLVFAAGIRVVERNTIAIESLTKAVEKLENLNQEAIKVSGEHGERITRAEQRLDNHDKRITRLEDQ